MIEIETLPFGRFFLPGPVDVRPETLAQMTKGMIGHRVPEMSDLMGYIQPRLKAIFGTTRPVYVSSSSATGLMEGAVRNGARRHVLSLVNGAFSQRFHRIALANGLKADALEVPWGQVHTPEMLDDALSRGIYDAVTVVHSETSTGALNPIRELAEVAHKNGDVAILVDSVSGLAGAPLLADDWRLDFVLTGSQKALAVPPGLAFGVAQESVLERARSKTDRGVYFDFLEFEKNLEKDQTPNTPAVSLLYALAEQADHIVQEGMEARWARHAAMAERTYRWVDAMNERGVKLEIFAPAGARSPTVTCIRLPEGWTGPKLVVETRKRGFAIATGYGKLKEESFRIGHMGEHTVPGLESLLEVLTDVLT
ncbi:MAG: alanine--glyoxylate aminotransferase family protein [Gemmatimonadota bacterium]|jgi:aspartate aminotransferase-like enzyme